MGKLTVTQITLRACCKGLFPQHEACMRVIELVGESNSEEILPQLPASLLSDVRLMVAEAPTSEEGWSGTSLILGGSFASEFNYEAYVAGWRARFRAGVEALRRHFADAADAEV